MTWRGDRYICSLGYGYEARLIMLGYCWLRLVTFWGSLASKKKKEREKCHDMLDKKKCYIDQTKKKKKKKSACIHCTTSKIKMNEMKLTGINFTDGMNSRFNAYEGQGQIMKDEDANSFPICRTKSRESLVNHICVRTIMGNKKKKKKKKP